MATWPWPVPDDPSEAFERTLHAGPQRAAAVVGGVAVVGDVKLTLAPPRQLEAGELI
jgi:hypothetical protein